MESIKNLAEKYTVGMTFKKIKDFLPALGVEKVPVQHGGTDVLGGKLGIWWPKLDKNSPWVNDRIPNERMEYPLIMESNVDPEANRIHLEEGIAKGPQFKMVFFREQCWNKRVMAYTGPSWLRYYGLYRLDVEMSVKEQKLCWVRIDPASLVQPLAA